MEAKIDNFSSWMSYSSDHQLKTDIEGLIIGSGFTIIKFIDHIFEPHGYTALWLLAESHCALHTFPEEKPISKSANSKSKICWYKPPNIQFERRNQPLGKRWLIDHWLKRIQSGVIVLTSKTSKENGQNKEEVDQIERGDKHYWRGESDWKTVPKLNKLS